MEQGNGANKRWIDLLASGLGAIGALVAVAGPIVVLGSQPTNPGSSVWPLPGLVLIDWAVLGVAGFLGAYLGTKPLPGLWSKIAWFVAGALIPLMALGALSIGPFVLLSLVFLAASAVLVTIHQRLKGLEILGAFVLGILLNLGLLLGLIVLGAGI